MSRQEGSQGPEKKGIGSQLPAPGLAISAWLCHQEYRLYGWVAGKPRASEKVIYSPETAAGFYEVSEYQAIIYVLSRGLLNSNFTISQ